VLTQTKDAYDQKNQEIFEQLNKITKEQESAQLEVGQISSEAEPSAPPDEPST